MLGFIQYLPLKSYSHYEKLQLTLLYSLGGGEEKNPISKFSAVLASFNTKVHRLHP